MLRDLPIRLLLVGAFLFSGLLPMMVVAILGLTAAKNELTAQAMQQLESVRDIKKQQIERFFDERAKQVEVLAADPYVKQAFKSFSNVFEQPENTAPLEVEGFTSKRFVAPDHYLQIHDKYFDYFEKYTRKHTYYDLFLMDKARGFTYFTVEKETDFGIPISEVDSSLKDVWLTATKERRVAISDTRPYSPSGSIPAQFIAAPVVEGDQIVGVVAVQISLDAIDEIMGTRSGMGRTGETYLVGRDLKMRSNSYLDPNHHSVAASFKGSIAQNGVQTEATRAVFQGVTSAYKTLSYNGREVLCAFAPLEFHGVHWAIIADIDASEIEEKIDTALNSKVTIVIVISMVLLLVLALSISVFISKGVDRVTAELGLLIGNVADGRLAARGQPDRVAYDFRSVVHRINELADAFAAKTEETRKLEEVIEYNQRMKSIGTLAGGIAHDFNNILTYLSSYADIVMTRLPENSDVQSHMEEITRGIDRAGDLVAQIMAFGRQIKREKSALEVALIVKEAVKLLKATIPKNIKVLKQIESPHVKVLSDPTQIHQIVINLCTNSFQSMLEKGGVMNVTLKRVQLHDSDSALLGLPTGDYCLLEVADTGVGMSDETMGRMFEPFFTTKPVGQGTGMGLAVVHGIVASYDGAIDYESEPGVGTKVRVYLPAVAESSHSESKSEEDVAIEGSGRILFVDDEEQIVKSAQLMLEGLGYVVDAFKDPRKALRHFKENPKHYDLMITDINMPKLNGLELYDQVRRLSSEIPVILVTGYNEFMPPESAKELGTELLLKPYKKAAISRVLKKLLT